MLWLLPHATASAQSFDRSDTKLAPPVHLPLDPLSVEALLQVAPEIGIQERAQAADLVAHGRVVRSHSFWNHETGIIETASVLRLEQRPQGDAPGEIPYEIVVRTEGGFIEELGIGMIAPHEASFAVGANVLVVAEKEGPTYRIIGDTTGKIGVGYGMGSDHSMAVGDDRAVVTATDVATDHSMHSMISAASAHGQQVRRWSGPEPHVAYRININTAQANLNGNSADAFIRAINAAAATWNQAPGADFSLVYAGMTQSTKTGYNGVNEIVFMPRGAENRGALAQVWYRRDLTILEADIWINDDFLWDVSGTLPSDRVDLQSVLTHEFGHWLILNHTVDVESVMYPSLPPGTVSRQLGRYDMEGIAAIYPCEQSACLPDIFR